MIKEELLNLFSENLSTIETFSNEFQQEIRVDILSYLNEVLNRIKRDLESDVIPCSFYDRISSLLNSLGIDEIHRLMTAHHRKHFFETYKGIVNELYEKPCFLEQTYQMFVALDFVSSNIVLIGANGCGKTNFANSIRAQLERTETGIVIPSQKLLIFPTYSSIPKYKNACEEYNNYQFVALNDKLTFNSGKESDIPYDLAKQYGRELKSLTSMLIAERSYKRNKYCSNAKDNDIVCTNDFRSSLDEIVEIWNLLIEHRTLFCEESCDLYIRYKEDRAEHIYPAYKMSDGEREIFYVVGRVLLAPESSLIIVDEPEMHLHKAILNKLWDILEKRRSDCTFIYLTHDVEFASTREAAKHWLKSYTEGPSGVGEWDIESLPATDIPEDLLMKLLGSRKKILFCEGKKNSLDRQIYELLFPNFTTIPIGSCKDVINYTKAFNAIDNKYAEAYGIIDRDFRTQDEIDACTSEKIYPLDVAEIENLFMLEDFVTGFVNYKRETCDIERIKNEVLSLLGQDKEKQVACYVSQRIEFYFKNSHIRHGRNNAEVTQHFNNFLSNVDVAGWYNQRMQEVEDIISSNDYAMAIKIYNNKSLHDVIKKALNYGDYRTKALEYLRESDEARKALLRAFPDELVNIATQN